jgi:hypothetical protein
MFNQPYAVAVAYVMYVSVFRMILRSMRMHQNTLHNTYVEKYAKIRIEYGKSTPGSKSFVTEIDRNLLISVLNEIVPFNAPKIDSVHAKHG